ncbi:MOSC domain-containing protein [Paenibacillus turpanensis]|uniref:MOSC domain-containing protein n=1 Tax=Paenibacillus turpanensis TaxID=2689078 RepID=UPI0014077E0B|nr:MOSC domain-containing protein [Paenibacillus turpanensis]
MKTFTAIVEAVLTATDPSTFVTRREQEIRIELAGIPGDRHYGLLRPADVRQSFYPRGTMIANRRQISIVGAEEMEQIATLLETGEILPEWLGANILLRGYAPLTLLPQGARLLFERGSTGLICEGENLPCSGPAKVIAASCDRPELAKKFVPAAKQKRGIVCSVEKEGTVAPGDTVRIMIP